MATVTVGTTTVDEVVAAVREDGYCIVHGVLDPEEVAAAKADLRRVLDATPTGRNDFEGYKTQRVYALFAKTRVFDGPAIHPLVLGVLDQLLAEYQLSAPVGIQIGPGEKAQGLHTDEGIYPLPRPHPDVVVNTMWPLDDFTEANGATVVIAGSHKWNPPRMATDDDQRIQAVMPAGSVMFYVGNLVHGGGANTTDQPRLGVILEYVVSWLRPQENHVLAVPKTIVSQLPERLQELLGYNIYPPFVGYVDGRHPRKFVDRDGVQA